MRIDRFDELTPEEREHAAAMLCDDDKPCDLRAEAEALKNKQ